MNKYELIGYVKEGEEYLIIKCFANRAKAIKYLNEHLKFDKEKNVVIDPGTCTEYSSVILRETLFDSENNNCQ